jgi:hypothetical protein
MQTDVPGEFAYKEAVFPATVESGSPVIDIILITVVPGVALVFFYPLH